MAKHKSATEVTVVTEERSAIQRWVDKHWGKALLVGIVVAGAIVYNNYSTKKAINDKADAWNPLLAAEGDLDKTKAALDKMSSPEMKGWAYAQLAREAILAEKPAEAAEALRQLSQIPDHVLNSSVFAMPGSNGKTLAQAATEAVSAQAEWEAANPGAFTNADPAEGSTVVTVKTSEGDIEVTLYDTLAPKHTENFLKHVDADYYDGTLFHRVVNLPTFAMIQGGDPNSLEPDTTKWGQGGPGYSIPAEKNGLMHLEGYLSSAMPPGSVESSGSQFFFTLSKMHHLDDRHTIYGKITGGMDIARKILEAPIRDQDPETNTRDIPVNPVSIQSVERK